MRLAALALTALCLSTGAPAESPPELIAYLPAERLATAAPQTPALRALLSDPRVSNLALAEIAAERVAGGALALTLPDGAATRLSFEGIDRTTAADGARTLSASNLTLGSTLALVLHGDEVAGTVQTPLGLYRIQSVGGGLTAVYRYDTRTLVDHPPGAPALPERPAPLAPEAAPTPPETGADGRTELDVIVAYTTAAAREVDGIGALIRLAVLETNQIYATSGIPARLRLVHAYETPYEGPHDMRVDLERFTDGRDGHTDEIHGLRDAHAADLAVLIVGKDKNACGYGWLHASEAFAFSVVAHVCATGYYSFAHEIGHNLGAHHNPEVSTNAVHPHGHGLCASGWRTVMAYYAEDCPPRHPVFSSSAPVDGVTVGDASRRDNARVHRETTARASRFRSRQGGGGRRGLRVSDTENFGVGGAAAGEGQQLLIFD